MGSEKSKQESSSTSSNLRSPAEVTQEFKAALPQLFDAMSVYQPQFNQLALSDLQQFGPEFAQSYKDMFSSVSPNQAQLPEELSRQALQMSQEGLSQEERDMYLNQFKSLTGNQVNAPIGAADISRSLLQQNLMAKQQGQNLGLGLASGVPSFGAAYQPQSGFNVGSAFSPIFANAGAVYGETGQSTSTTTTTPSALQMGTSILGGAAGLMSGMGAIGMLGGAAGAAGGALNTGGMLGAGAGAFGGRI